MEACHIYKTISSSLANDPETATSLLRTPQDAVAIAVHAWALHSGLQYEGYNEDTSKSVSFGLEEIKPLDATWKRGAPNFYSFRYTKNHLPVDLTVTKNAGFMMVNGLLGGKNVTAKVDPNKLVSSAFFQHPDGSEEVHDAFRDEAAVEQLCDQLDREVLDKLIPQAKDRHVTPPPPGLARGLQEEMDTYSRASTPSNMPHSRPFTPSVPSVSHISPDSKHEPRMPGGPISTELPPGFEDEYEVFGKLRHGHNTEDMRRPMAPNLGQNDLNPPGLGPHPPMQPYLPGPGGPGGNGGGNGAGHGGGMYMGMDDPIFRAGGLNRPGASGEDHPPGARYDPRHPNDFRGGGGFGSGPGGFI
ncbi:hypothetical protein TRVA0_042S00562 [Trichomonascus vanleenenianus]|uniref:proteasome inhibitor PI31 family protein n=1 Tax=Trichomonascus vanleenenianus TaxID=2268995 RepID=UPI003ECA6A4F